MKRLIVACKLLMLMIACTIIGFGTPLIADNGVIHEDILVNDDMNGGCDQDDPVIASNGLGSAVVVWSDSRFASATTMGQLLDSDGNRIGSNFRITDSKSAWGERPYASMNSVGSFIVVWSDYRLGYDCIFMQAYDSHGRQISPVRRVSENASDVDALRPCVSLNDDGSCVVAWYQESKLRRDEVFVRVFDASGDPSTDGFQVSGTPGSDSRYPRIASAADGRFGVVWSERLSHAPEIYARLFNQDGVPAGDAYVVNDPLPGMRSYRPAISMLPDGRHAITWIMRRGSGESYNAYLRLFDQSGNDVSDPIVVNEEPLSSSIFHAEIVHGESGNFIVAWADKRTGDYRVYSQVLDGSGNPLGRNEPMALYWQSERQVDVAIAICNDDRVLAAWEEGPSSSDNIRGTVIDFQGKPLSDSYVISDDEGSAIQQYPNVDCNAAGMFASVWIDQRSSDYRPYFQLFGEDGSPVGDNVLLSDSTVDNIQTPCVAIDGIGRSIALWNQSGTVVGRALNASGAPVAPPFVVNDVPAYGWPNHDLAIKEDGTCIISWSAATYTDESLNGIYAQRFEMNGNSLGGKFMVNDCLERIEYNPTIDLRTDGGFAVGWYGSESNDSSGVFFRIFDADDQPLTGDILIESSSEDDRDYKPCISLDELNNISICWKRYSGGHNHVLTRRYDHQGQPIGQALLVSHSPHTRGDLFPRITTAPGGASCIVWQSLAPSNRNAYMQFIDSDGNAIGTNMMIPQPSNELYRQQYPAVASSGDAVFLVWEDARRGKSYDVYLKAVEWPATRMVSGDTNGDGVIDVDDAAFLVGFAFASGSAPDPLESGDVDLSGGIDIDDVVYLMNFIFGSGPAPVNMY